MPALTRKLSFFVLIAALIFGGLGAADAAKKKGKKKKQSVNAPVVLTTAQNEALASGIQVSGGKGSVVVRATVSGKPAEPVTAIGQATGAPLTLSLTDAGRTLLQELHGRLPHR